MEYTTRWISLATRVIATASLTYTDEWELLDWTAYIDSVKGINHNDEWQEVAKSGDKLPSKIAVAIFPNLPIEKFRR